MPNPQANPKKKCKKVFGRAGNVWDIAGLLQGYEGLSLENSEKSLKTESRGLSALESEKVQKKS